MYCPRCEFEIKQDVTECPICGGPLTEYPEAAEHVHADDHSADIDAPRETSLNDILLDAKHELDSLQDKPESEPQAVEPLPSDLDLDSILSEETSGSFTPETGVPDVMEDQPPSTDHGFFPDDEKVMHDGDTPFPNDYVPAGEKQPPEESPQSEQTIFLDEKLFIDEADPLTPDTPEDSGTGSGATLEKTLDSLEIPDQQEQASSEFETTPDMNFIPEGQAEQPETAPTENLAFIDVEEAGSAAETDAQTGHSRSKLRPVVFGLIGVFIIAGAYVAADYFLKPYQPEQQIKKPTAPARTSKPEPARQPAAPPKKPAAPAEPRPPAAPTVVPDKAAPAEAEPGRIMDQTPALKPEPTAPETVRTDTAITKPEAEKSIAPEKKPEAAAAAGVRRQETPPAQGKEKSAAVLPFSIHLSSFKTQEYAQNEIRRLRGLGIDAYLETADLGEKGLWYRVKAGHYATRKQAEQAIQDIKKKNPGTNPLIYKKK